ncbi:MAG: ribonuclease PH [Alphaproteobacteria bacterium 33-17]|nr:MAG: ribonuclease PH [Alphaproteobacteria bacterium 33-17]
MRLENRKNNEMRPVSIETNVSRYAEGSCMIKFGNTHVLCTATIEESVPPFIKGTGSGWITAEYGMLPRSTHSRMRREASQGKQSGRTQEIQRLIGRSLRNAVDLKALGERQILIDCDVIQADGGTRTASITGGFVALQIACNKLVEKGLLRKSPIINNIAAVSCGILKGEVILDLNYEEDSSAEVDANFVMNGNYDLIETQATGEEKSYTREQLNNMLEFAEMGIKQLIEAQKAATK